MDFSLNFKSELEATQKGVKLVEYIKAKYSDNFYIAKHSKDTNNRLKALDYMAFLDEIIEEIKDKQDE